MNRKRVYFSEPFNALYRDLTRTERYLQQHTVLLYENLPCCKDRTCSSFCSASRRLSVSNMCRLSEADMTYTITTISIRKSGFVGRATSTLTRNVHICISPTCTKVHSRSTFIATWRLGERHAIALRLRFHAPEAIANDPLFTAEESSVPTCSEKVRIRSLLSRAWIFLAWSLLSCL